MPLPALTKKELATVAGYTYRRLHDIDVGLPEDRKFFVESATDPGKCDLAAFVQRWVAYNKDAATPDDEETDLNRAKTRHEVVKTEKTQLEVARLRGALVDVQEVKRLWGDVAKAVSQNLLGLPKKLGPALVMMDNAEEISAMIDDEVRIILNDIADTPLPSYVEDEESESEDE